MNATDFYTRTPANTPQKYVLPDPITNAPTEEFLMVLGFDSDVFRKALVENSRSNVEILTLPEGEQEAARNKNDVILLASLVTGWSFKETFSQEAVITLLGEAPYLERGLDKFGANRANFIKRQQVK